MSIKRPTKIEDGYFLSSFVVWLIAISGTILTPIHHRLFDAACRALGILVPKKVFCTVTLNGDSKFRFQLKDHYWNRLVWKGCNYEDEIAFVLDKIQDINFLFIDCGANFGFWSIQTASDLFGNKKTVAIEALKSTYQNLIINKDINKSIFTSINRAISEKSGEKVKIYCRGRHAGSSLVSEWLGNPRKISEEEIVETLSIDDIIHQFQDFSQQPVVIKLDVEGVEIAALCGAKKALNREALIIYEDYGEDKKCKVSQFVLEELKLKVFYLDERKRMVVVSNVKEINRIKTQPNKGYNFFAVNKNSVFDKKLSEFCKIYS